ncbi:MAG TPA: biopolymer transporter ExbD [Candidatus Hydrogenedentes bacterium]|nr:biopolymer transporter ExbD [Candidatus Hydrogenedentota bacterium]HOV74726.1 biopolymer transporter ExbD [Candidatus Hydrogenedentota bacterium]
MMQAAADKRLIRFRKERKPRIRPTIDMTALMDVVLNLLIFFMLGTTFATQFPVTIKTAEAAGPSAYEEKDLSITLSHEGGIFVNEEQVGGFDEVSRILAEAHAQRPDITVVIRPDARIESARLIEVLGLVNDAGIRHCTIAARPAGPPQR